MKPVDYTSTARAEREQDVDQAQPEKRDVSQPHQAAAERPVAAQPVLAIKTQTDERARNRAEQKTNPSGKKVDRAIHGHSLIFVIQVKAELKSKFRPPPRTGR